MTLAALAAAVDAAADAPLDGALDQIRPFLADIGWFQAWMTQQTRCMQADPLHLPPVRASRNGAVRHLVFARTERIWVTATIISPPARIAERLHFSGRHALCRPLNRAVEGEVFGIEGDRAVRRGPIHAPVGSVFELDERREALRLTPGTGPLMMLRAQVAPPGPVLSRLIDVASGQVRALAQADEGHARTLMLLSLLRLQGRGDAAACFDAALDAPLPAQRWAVMREYLALDAAAALAPLADMARADPDAQVRALARQTMARLEPEPCPA